MHTKLVITVILLLALGSLGSAVVLAQEGASSQKPADVTVLELNDQIKSQKAKVSALKSQIASYQQMINAKQSEAASLQNQMAIIEDKVAKTALDIEATGDEITQIDLEAAQLDIEIKAKEREIGVQKERLSEFVRQTYQNDQKNLLEILIMNERFSDFYDQVKYLEETHREVSETLGKVKFLKDQLTTQRNGLEVSRKRQEELRAALEVQKSEMEEQKVAQQSLVVQSVMTSNKFQSLLDEARAQESDIAAQIGRLEDDVKQRLRVESNGLVSLGWPVDPTRGVSAYFRDPGYPFRNVMEHSAIDIRAYQSTPVKAAEGGYVAVARNAGMGYSYIMILHDKGLATVYGHISSIFATQDTYVKKGQVIGLSGGAPGTPGAGPFTTGPHLHFEVRLNGIPVDPLKYLP